MVRWWRVVAGLVLLSFLSASSVLAQSATETTGGINGTVTDSSGAVLPNVLVTLSGSSEMGSPTTMSGPNGFFRFAAVLPGDYKLKFTLAGFGTMEQQGIHVGIGFVATVDAVMKPGSVSESITVTGEAPVIDTTNTVVATHFDDEKLIDLPGSRDINAVLSLTPAVSMQAMDVGGNKALVLAAYTAYGLTAATGVNRNDVEGIRVGADNGTNDNYFPDYNAFAEIVVNTVGDSAVASNPGTYDQYVVKSGGNEFHGDVYYDFENKALEWKNIDANQIAAGVAGSPTLSVYDTDRINKYTDFDAGAGGYIIKDKLWFYGAYRYTDTEQAYSWLTDGAAVLSNTDGTLKTTYNLTSRQKLIAFIQYDYANQPDYVGGSAALPIQKLDALGNDDTPFTVFKGEYDNAITNNLYFEIRYGAYLSGYVTHAKTSLPRISDTGANTVQGGNSNTGLTRNRPQGNYALSYLKNGWGVSHTFKFGGEIMVDNLTAPFDGYGDACDCVSTLVNGVPSTVQIYSGFNVSKETLWTYAWYADDTWQVKPRLTLNLGVRLDLYKPSLPAQTGPTGQQFAATSNFPLFKNWGPRIGFAYALTRDRKNVLKVHFGQAYLYPGVNFAAAFNPNPSGWYNTYKWTSDSQHLGYWVPSDGLGTLTASSGGTASTQLASNIQNTYVRQATAYYEREFGHDLGVRAGFVWNGRRNLYLTVNDNLPLSAFSMPIQISIPGTNGKAAVNPVTVTGYNVPTSLVGVTPLNTEQNIPEGNSNYYTMEYSATKRTGRWTLQASFTKTWSHETAIAGSSTYNPNAFVNTDGGFNNYTNWQAKASGTGNLPWKFKLIPTLRYQSGTPFGRTFTQTFNYGTTSMLAEPYNSERTPNIALVDSRVERSFTFKDRFVASAFFDVYNIFNSNGDQTLTTTSGSSWLRPTLITGPRIVRVGAKFSF